jgi:hypothetical protein
MIATQKFKSHDFYLFQFQGFGAPIGASSNVKTGSNKTEKAFVPKLPEKAINTKN